VDEGSELTDERLVLLSKDGDLDAFNRLVDRFQGTVYSLCLRLLGNPQAAEDATQEAFLSAFRSISRFEGGNFRSWLLRIAANESKDELRRRSRRDRAGSLDQMFGTLEAPIEVPDPAPGADIEVERKELGATLQRALDRLPFDQRQAVVLLDVHGYRYEEIATMTGSSLGTVKSRIHRARERLRRDLSALAEPLTATWRLDS
jgi:RNA polymerase sigma-70 factor (ECF subfamily)